MSAYDDKLLAEGLNYSVGTNDGRAFNKVTFIGKKMHNGKEMLSFALEENSRQLVVNPSYMCWALEEGEEEEYGQINPERNR